VLFKVLAGIVPALPYLFLAVRIPCALFLDNVVLNRAVKQTAQSGNPLAENKFKLGTSERRGYFVFDNLNPDAVADSVGVF
jgi:hypothetical protein